MYDYYTLIKNIVKLLEVYPDGKHQGLLFYKKVDITTSRTP